MYTIYREGSLAFPIPSPRHYRTRTCIRYDTMRTKILYVDTKIRTARPGHRPGPAVRIFVSENGNGGNDDQRANRLVINSILRVLHTCFKQNIRTLTLTWTLPELLNHTQNSKRRPFVNHRKRTHSHTHTHTRVSYSEAIKFLLTYCSNFLYSVVGEIFLYVLMS